MFAFAFRAIASGNRIANLFLFVCWKKEGSGQFSCWGLNPDQRIESPVPYPLRQLAHCFESHILRAKLSRDSKFLKSLRTKKSRNARHANTRSAKHQCETSVCQRKKMISNKSPFFSPVRACGLVTSSSPRTRAGISTRSSVCKGGCDQTPHGLHGLHG